MIFHLSVILLDEVIPFTVIKRYLFVRPKLSPPICPLSANPLGRRMDKDKPYCLSCRARDREDYSRSPERACFRPSPRWFTVMRWIY